MNARVRVIVVPVDGHIRVEEIDDSLPAMQRLVGGFVERVDLGDGLDVWCNEEADILRLPPNRFLRTGDGFPVEIRGLFFLARRTSSGRLADVTQFDVEAWVDTEPTDVSQERA